MDIFFRHKSPNKLRMLTLLLYLMVLKGWATPYIEVLGIAQDGGVPHAGCQGKTCHRFKQAAKHLQVASLAIVDETQKRFWMIDASYQFPEQFQKLKRTPEWQLAGIFLTHAHIGHYTGLMFLGREVMGMHRLPVYVMTRMSQFLKNNGPWSQLVNLKNIELHSLRNQQPIRINADLSITPIQVPHRDEYSETVGYLIQGKSRKVLYIPDINHWRLGQSSIRQWITQVDRAYLDGTFFDNRELKRRMQEVPHPFVSDSMTLFNTLPLSQRQKIYFIHFNHTNPLLIANSPECKKLFKLGYNIAEQGDRIHL